MQTMRPDPRIIEYRDAALAMVNGCFDVELPAGTNDEVAELGQALLKLGHALERKMAELRKIMRVTTEINSGLLLDEILEHLYQSFRDVIPYDRIGFSLVSEDRKEVTAYWAKSERIEMKLGNGYSAPLNESSLKDILDSGRPRVINDLEAYLAEHPGSDSTRLIVAEGIRSSLTCPLITAGQPVGFMFFSSMHKNTYRDLHVESFLQIAGLLSTIVEKGRMYQRLLELDALKNKFLGIAAHDLRNPLSVIRGFADLLLNAREGDSTPEEREEALLLVRDSADNMLNLVNDLLDVSAIEAGRLDLTWDDLSLPSVLLDYQTTAMLMASRKKIDVEMLLGDDLPDIRADRHRLGQVMDNLVSNAVKFSYPESTIRIGCRALEHEVEFSVADEGQGIPDEEQPQLFTDFGRTSVKPTHGESSTGLGLAIVKRIIDAHGGSILVESKLGRGSTFRIILPIRSHMEQHSAQSPFVERRPQ